MKEQFVIYEIALKLKELGFDELCFGWWCWINGSVASFYNYKISNPQLIELNNHKNNCSAPLYQQVIDWFREKYDYNLEIRRNWPKLKYFYTIDHPTLREVSKATYNYSEAREQAILKAIEIIQKK